jgi:hypothetical protein
MEHFRSSEKISFEEFYVCFAKDLQAKFIETGAFLHSVRNKEGWLKKEYDNYVSGEY